MVELRVSPQFFTGQVDTTVLTSQRFRSRPTPEPICSFRAKLNENNQTVQKVW